MKKTIAAGLASDPRIAQAKRLLLDTIAEHQRNITGIRPPDAESQQSYEELLAEFGQVRGAPLFYPYIGSGIGRGPFVELADGSIKYRLHFRHRGSSLGSQSSFPDRSIVGCGHARHGDAGESSAELGEP